MPAVLPSHALSGVQGLAFGLLGKRLTKLLETLLTPASANIAPPFPAIEPNVGLLRPVLFQGEEEGSAAPA